MDTNLFLVIDFTTSLVGGFFGAVLGCIIINKTMEGRIMSAIANLNAAVDNLNAAKVLAVNAIANLKLNPSDADVQAAADKINAAASDLNAAAQ